LWIVEPVTSIPSVNLAEPDTSKVWDGDVVPMPTLPDEEINARDVPVFPALKSKKLFSTLIPTFPELALDK
jgi:hypothetical protein